MDAKVEQAGRKMALFAMQVKLTRSNAAMPHGGSRKAQIRKRRQEGRKEAREA